jgi:sterol desaturase/sphingolipid hydroxylase (fatty acid hydroxylase superfamily)
MGGAAVTEASRESYSAVERVVAATAFPLVLGGCLWLGTLAMEAGTDPSLAAGLSTGLGALLVLGLERLFPHHRSWLRSHNDVRTDLAYVVTIVLTTGLTAPLFVYAAVSLAGWLGPMVGLGFWPAAWPWIAQLPLALVVAELPKYWHHRLEHETDLLWRYHSPHHSVPRLYFLNAARFHPIDIAIDNGLGLMTLVVLGCPVEVIALFTLLAGVHGYFQHANLKIRIGPLNYFFSMAELHRWHHSRDLSEANHNYGQNVIVWDLVFGSFFLPSDREPPEDIGIPDLPAFPMTFWRQLAVPFQWRRIREASRPLR